MERVAGEAGWSGVLRVPALTRDVDLCLQLLQTSDLSIHPGSFYGFPQRGYLILSLLPPEDVFRAGIDRLASAIQ